MCTDKQVRDNYQPEKERSTFQDGLKLVSINISLLNGNPLKRKSKHLNTCIYHCNYLLSLPCIYLTLFLSMLEI